MLGAEELAAYIKEKAVEAELIRLPVKTLTVEAAAEAVQTQPEQIIKSLVFLVNDDPVVVIACGPDRIDRRPIAAHFEVGRKRVRLADADAVLQITGYAVGAVPPFGHREQLATLMDRRVMDWNQVYAGGGEVDTLLRMDPAEIMRVTGALPIDFAGAAAERGA